MLKDIDLIFEVRKKLEYYCYMDPIDGTKE